MKRILRSNYLLTTLMAVASIAVQPTACWAQGRGGRGSLGNVGGNGARPMGGGGGMSRPAMPNMNARPAMPVSRPSLGNSQMPSRPNVQPNIASRPNINLPQSRPNIPNVPNLPAMNPGGGNTPSLGSNRPSLGGIGVPNIQSPNINRPNIGANSGGQISNKLPPVTQPSTRPTGPLPPTTKPTWPSNNLGVGTGNIGAGNNVGGSGSIGGITTLPSNKLPPRPDKPSLGGIQRPNPLPGTNVGGINTKPSTLPGTIKPAPGITTKPAPLPGNPNNRPGIATKPSINVPNINIPGVNLPGVNRPSIGGTRPGGITTLPGNIKPPAGNWGNGTWGNGNGGNGNWGNGNWGNGNNIGSGNWGNGNNFVNINRPAWDRPNWNSGWGNGWGVDPGFSHGHGWNHGWYDHCVHPHYHGWYNGCWAGYWTSAWYAPITWGAVGWGLGAYTNTWQNTYAYTNPYYVPTTTVNNFAPPYDYSQPVVVNNFVDIPADATTGTDVTSSLANDANKAPLPTPDFNAFDAGLDAFKQQNYGVALERFDEALAKSSKDPVVHEVRALTLFAMGEYKQAAIALNSLLAAAPGMDWTTLSSIYGDTDVYTTHLRSLEAYCKAHSTDASSAFVLAYHYLVIGSKEEAIHALEVVVKNEPKDLTARRMLEALKPPAAEIATNPQDDAKTDNDSLQNDAPKPEIDLVGSWVASLNDSTIALDIDEDSSFRWTARETGKPEIKLAGTMISAVDGLILDTTDQGSLSGAVEVIAPDQWRFLPPGAKRGQQGIEFRKKN